MCLVDVAPDLHPSFQRRQWARFQSARVCYFLYLPRSRVQDNNCACLICKAQSCIHESSTWRERSLSCLQPAARFPRGIERLGERHVERPRLLKRRTARERSKSAPATNFQDSHGRESGAARTFNLSHLSGASVCTCDRPLRAWFLQGVHCQMGR